MSVIYILLPLALVIVAGAIIAFVWAARRGQFDDMETPAMRIVLDDEDRAPPGPESAPSRRENDATPAGGHHS